MRIIKSKRESNCYFCNQTINGKYKVEYRTNTYIHLSCYYKWIEKRIKVLKMTLKELKKQKYKKQISLEILKKGLKIE